MRLRWRLLPLRRGRARGRIRIAASAAAARMGAGAVRLRRWWWRGRVGASCRAVANMDMGRGSIARLTLEMVCKAVPIFVGAVYIGRHYSDGDPSTILITLFTVAVIAVGLLLWNMFNDKRRDERIEALEKGQNDLRSAFEQHVAQYEKDKKEMTEAIERVAKDVAELKAAMASGFERIGKELAEQRFAIERIEKDVAELKSWRNEQMAHRCDCCGRSAP